MTAPNNKPVPPEMLVRFAAYRQRHPAWGSLHIVLDEGNVRDEHVEFCRNYAIEHGDAEGAELAEALLGMSKSQRLRLNSRL